MELPQSRPFGTEGRKPTHDFLSLYSHATVQQDPRPPSQGGYLKTHDFLQPLERVGMTGAAKEETAVEISSTAEKPLPPAQPPPSSVEHILPGGIGTYSISHISYFNQKVPKPEGAMFSAAAQTSSTERNDENSNCSSYTGSGFTLWEESAVKKGKTRKENTGERSSARDSAAKARQWASVSSSNNNSSSHHNSISSRSSSQPPGPRSQSFIEMIKSAAKGIQAEDLDDEEEFVMKKESSTTTTTITTTTNNRDELRVKVDGKNTDQKPNTPRSKHSATEQRRRSKINDRFQMLRELIPHSDQKRDKASFLLEVIEYIQFLQEKVQKFEGSYLGWNQESAKLMQWRNSPKPTESYVDQARDVSTGPVPALVFSAKFDEKKVAAGPTIPGNASNPTYSDLSSPNTLKPIDHQAGIADKALPFPISLQPSYFNPVKNGVVATQLPSRLMSDSGNRTSQPQAPLYHTRTSTSDAAVASDRLKEQELTVEGGSISISTAYSQGLLNTLTQALQNSGVDLSQASISVQIDLGKRASNKETAPSSTAKDNQVPSTNQGTTRSRVDMGENFNRALKKLKKDKS